MDSRTGKLFIVFESIWKVRKLNHLTHDAHNMNIRISWIIQPLSYVFFFILLTNCLYCFEIFHLTKALNDLQKWTFLFTSCETKYGRYKRPSCNGIKIAAVPVTSGTTSVFKFWPLLNICEFPACILCLFWHYNADRKLFLWLALFGFGFCSVVGCPLVRFSQVSLLFFCKVAVFVYFLYYLLTPFSLVPAC